jgi:DNA-binding MarR family transcriptional regulator
MNTNDTHNHLAADLRTAVTRLMKKLQRTASAGYTLSLTERSTFSLLEQKGPMLPSELAASEKITAQSMSQILNHLHELGLIVRTPDPNDGRRVLISVSDYGRNKLNEVRSQRDEWLNQALAQTCTPAEQELLRQAIGPLTKLVNF